MSSSSDDENPPSPGASKKMKKSKLKVQHHRVLLDDGRSVSFKTREVVSEARQVQEGMHAEGADNEATEYASGILKRESEAVKDELERQANEYYAKVQELQKEMDAVRVQASELEGMLSALSAINSTMRLQNMMRGTKTSKRGSENKASKASNDEEAGSSDENEEFAKPANIVAFAIDLSQMPLRDLLVASTCSCVQLLLLFGFLDASWLETVLGTYNLFGGSIQAGSFYKGNSRQFTLCGLEESCTVMPNIMLGCSIVALLMFAVVTQKNEEVLRTPLPIAELLFECHGPAHLLFLCWAQLLWAFTVITKPVMGSVGLALALSSSSNVQDVLLNSLAVAFVFRIECALQALDELFGCEHIMLPHQVSYPLLARARVLYLQRDGILSALRKNANLLHQGVALLIHWACQPEHNQSHTSLHSLLRGQQCHLVYRDVPAAIRTIARLQ
mmetsp:Transcript_26970/g.54221  ORF Transcript_26970/g.54221 Transcript_26970/m.54221 type:complete len:446 (-) Transcript_26970:697-2034(-)